MDPDRYLACLDDDSARLLAAVGDLDAPVPTCPGWTVRDAVLHTGEVFTDKVAYMQLNRRPVEGEWSTGPEPGGDVLEWYAAAYDGIRRELLSRRPDDSTPTWWPADQTVRFWYRRMAHEVAVHRVDVESAYGEPTPVAADLAVDGIDEFLRIFLFSPWGAPQPFERSRSVRVESGGRQWVVRMGPDGGSIDAVGADAGGIDAVVSGEPSDVELWLWARLPDDRVSIDGDADALADFRRWLYAAGQ